MSVDSGARLPDPPRADFTLPNVVDIQIRATTFDPRKPRNFAPTLPSSKDAVEFIVKTDGPIPIRALGPALYVGTTPVTEVTEIAENTYRFVAMTKADLKQDAEIILGWTGKTPVSGGKAAFQYRL
jgi:hypothetical protein